MTEINFDLFSRLASMPHPLTNIDHPCDCHHWCGEINREAHVSHHLLDLVKIPHGERDEQHLDARTWRAVMFILELQGRLDRIATWHRRETADGGMVGDYCVECDLRWPCDSRKMADGVYVDP